MIKDLVTGGLPCAEGVNKGTPVEMKETSVGGSFGIGLELGFGGKEVDKILAQKDPQLKKAVELSLKDKNFDPNDEENYDEEDYISSDDENIYDNFNEEEALAEAIKRSKKEQEQKKKVVSKKKSDELDIVLEEKDILDLVAEDVNNILKSIDEVDPKLAKKLQNVDLGQVAREIVDKLGKDDEQPEQQRGVGWFFQELFGIHSAEGAALVRPTIQVGKFAWDKYKKQIISYIAKKAQSLVSDDVVAIVGKYVDARTDAASDYLNGSLEKSKHKDKGKSQPINSNKSQLPGGGGAPHDPDEDPFKWEVKDPKEAPKIGYHNKHKQIYKDPNQKIGNKDIWWTKDTAGHSGQSQGLEPSKYKLYERTAREFKWLADVDKNGNIIPKTKSGIGKNIPLNEINWIK